MAAEMEKCPVHDGEELDPRLEIEALELPSDLPSCEQWFVGMSTDERGLVLRYDDDVGLQGKTHEIEVIFPNGYDHMRMCPIHAEQAVKLTCMVESMGSLPIFCALRCRYTNYFDWAVRHALFPETFEEGEYHYILAAEDTLVEVLTRYPPEVRLIWYS